MMIKALTIFAVVIFFGGMMYQFAALKVFNLLVPKDQASEFFAGSLAYGSDRDQTLDVYRPRTGNAPFPVLIFVHGGSWKDGDGKDYEFVGRAFAAQGYLTLVTNYRLLPRHAYPDFIYDVANAVAWANRNAVQYGGDGTKVFLIGHSAGAYNVAQAVLDMNYFKIAGADPKSIKAVATLAGPFDFLPLDSPVTIETFGHLTDLPATQPINFVRPDAPPFLLLHGLADTTVYPKNGRSLLQRLKAVGAQATLVEYVGVSHAGIMLALAKPLRGNAPVLEDIVRFFKDRSK